MQGYAQAVPKREETDLEATKKLQKQKPVPPPVCIYMFISIHKKDYMRKITDQSLYEKAEEDREY